MSIMANYWAENGWHITLITLAAPSTDFYSITPNVTRVGLDMLTNSNNPLFAIRNNIIRIFRLRRAIRATTPDSVICFMDRMNIITSLALVGTGIPLILSERTDPAHHQIGNFWEVMRKLCYPLASTLVVQSETVKSWFEKTISNLSIVVIPNPVLPVVTTTESLESLRSYLNLSENCRIIVAMGRLGQEKGFDILIKSFSDIATSNNNWHLVIFGEGALRRKLQNLIEHLNISSRIHLPGRISNPSTYLKQADIFVMSSRYEGFPNALCEAMACGLPVISTDCPSGPREIIRDGIDGILVTCEDRNALAQAMNKLMNDEIERKHLSNNATEVLERFAIKKVMGMWEQSLKTGK